ncbi:amidase [Phaeacidiphilus oryzae]|uniref:amidase n=1 Tax=Phaeacidiphilus oryzae TaxID=348818 RepID=UPI00055D8EF6|nr:amidase [Phaeacidiphilus oryzae]
MPADSEDLVYLSATEAMRLFAARELSPVELMEAVIDRTEKVEPRINAFTERLFDEALEQAREAERVYGGTAGREPRPLEGVPLALKEKHGIAGRSLTEGSLANEGNVAAENSPLTDRVLASGAIVHARTTTPEFSIAGFTWTRKWGVTRNPWHLESSPGGSSGGSGASLAAGTSLLASGSDIGGSTRIPAAYNGVVGFKAPYGRIPGNPPLAADFYRGDGPLARTVDDCVAFANVLIGPDPRDHTSLRPSIQLPTAYEPAAGMRIALCVGLGDYEVDAEMEANTRAAAQALADAGAVVEEIELPWRRADVGRAVASHFANMFARTVEDATEGKRELLSPYTQLFLEQMEKVRAGMHFFDGVRIEAALQRQLAEAMAPFDALLCPTTRVPAIPAKPEITSDESLDVALTSPFNINNRCPVLAVPSGHAASGIPTGVQIVGHTYDDATVFRVGKALETTRPWAYGPDHRPTL